ncbi:MAG TPA: hypothetical protein VEJ18_21675 [Planctomycetota bacterium]|nr:hypothetical protein [Planctomycetota bacterium]
MSAPASLPPECEGALLDRFLRAEAMAMWAVRSAQTAEAPAHALAFLKRHEEEEAEHLRHFEKETGVRAREKAVLPKVPRQWHALAVQLYGYEALGLEFARLLASVRPDLGHILRDEEVHVGFFETEVRKILAAGRGPANGAREFARAWLRRLPRTLDRYLRGDGLDAHRDRLREEILASIRARFTSAGLPVDA